MNDEIFAKIAEQCAYLWGCDVSEITPDTTFEEHNTKSVMISKITTSLEDEYDCEVPYMQFKRNKTLGEASAFVAELVEE